MFHFERHARKSSFWQSFFVLVRAKLQIMTCHSKILQSGEFYLFRQIGLPSRKWHLWLCMKPLKCICKSIFTTLKFLGQSQWTLDPLALLCAQAISLGKYLLECCKFDTSCDSLSKLDKSSALGYKKELIYKLIQNCSQKFLLEESSKINQLKTTVAIV